MRWPWQRKETEINFDNLTNEVLLKNLENIISMLNKQYIGEIDKKYHLCIEEANRRKLDVTKYQSSYALILRGYSHK